MATNHTEQYGLNQWESTDAVERVDFNADNLALEKALTAHDAQIKTLKSSVSSTGSNLSKCYSPSNQPYQTGSYVGNSSNTKSDSNTQDIVLGFTPSFVVVYRLGETPVLAMANTECPHDWNDSMYVNLEIIENGFRAGSPNSSGTLITPQVNSNGVTYLYFAMK